MENVVERTAGSASAAGTQPTRRGAGAGAGGAARKASKRDLVRRFLVPRPLVTLVAWARWRAFVSPRAEVELTPHLALGRGTAIGSFSKLKATAGPLRLGARVDVATGAFITSGEGGIEIGDDCLVGPHVAIVGVNYRYDRLDLPIREQGTTSRGIRIGRNVWIGASASILDGARIGDGAIVAPGSVVSGSVPENAIVQGNPAKVVFTRR